MRLFRHLTQRQLRLLESKLKEHPVLQDLSQQQLEKALEWLHQPVQTWPLPPELKNLTEWEWHLLQRMLYLLLEEKQEHPLQ